MVVLESIINSAGRTLVNSGTLVLVVLASGSTTTSGRTLVSAHNAIIRSLRQSTKPINLSRVLN